MLLCVQVYVNSAPAILYDLSSQDGWLRLACDGFFFCTAIFHVLMALQSHPQARLEAKEVCSCSSPAVLLLLLCTINAELCTDYKCYIAEGSLDHAREVSFFDPDNLSRHCAQPCSFSDAGILLCQVRPAFEGSPCAAASGAVVPV